MDICIVCRDSIYLTDQFPKLRLLHAFICSQHLHLESVVLSIVQLYCKHSLVKLLHLRLPHGQLPSNHLQLEPVDIYIL